MEARARETGLPPRSSLAEVDETCRNVTLSTFWFSLLLLNTQQFFLSTKQLQTYSSNIANDVATGCFLITKGFFCFKLTSDKPVSSFIVTDGSCTEEMKTLHWNNIKHCCFSVG